MNSVLKTAVALLALVASIFLIGVLVWLFYCNCGRHDSGIVSRETGRPELALKDLGYSLWDDKHTLATLAQLRNVGDATAKDVRVTQVTIDGGAYKSPVLPDALGNMRPGEDNFVNAILNLEDLDGRAHILKVIGDYALGSGRAGFVVSRVLSPSAEDYKPITSKSSGAKSQTIKTAVFPPSPPQSADLDLNDDYRPLIPLGPPVRLFPPTPKGTAVQASSSGAPVEITYNTQIGVNTTGWIPPDPSVAPSGNVVIATFNKGVAYSIDGGKTFTAPINMVNLNPPIGTRTSFFPENFGGHGGDQVVVYLQRQNLLVWLIQYEPTTCAPGPAVANCPPPGAPAGGTTYVTAPGALRIAWATPEAAKADFYNA